MFLGRKKELNDLNRLYEKDKGAALVYGKRRTGKTTLILKSLENIKKEYIYYECIKGSLKENLSRFINELVRKNIFKLNIPFETFTDVFNYLTTLDSKFIVVIDEYPYLKLFENGEYIDSLFQNIIDNYCSKINLIISGSHIGVMKSLKEENSSLYGRFDLVIDLKPFDYYESSLFYESLSPYDKVAFYSVFGGSPFVLEKLDYSKTLKENIINTFLDTNSPIYSYVENGITSDISTKDSSKRIFSLIRNSKEKYKNIENKLGYEHNGLLNKQISTLINMEFISKSYPINKPNDNKKVYFELVDNPLRFYFTYIYGNSYIIEQIGKEAFFDNYIENSLNTFISYRFEDIVKQYFSLLSKKNVMMEIYNIGSYYYDDPKNKSNGEFDVALKKKNTYEIIEVKYYKEKLKNSVIENELKQISNIKEIEIDGVGFVSINGFEKINHELKYQISGEDLYNL